MHTIKQFLSRTISIPKKPFIIWRSLLGVYFVYYAFRILPYVSQIYGPYGMVPDIHYNWTYGIFPNIFSLVNSVSALMVTHYVIALMGSLLLFGLFPRTSALVLWYLQTALYNRNNLTDDPSQAFVGLLLLTLVLIPHQPKINDKHDKDVLVPYFVFFIPIFIFCSAFTASAIDKLSGISWQHGTAFWDMLHLSIARHTIFDVWLITHTGFTIVLSYIAAATQLVCLPFFLIGKYRWSLAISFLSFSIMFVLFDLNQVIYGMLFFYSFFLLRDIPFCIQYTRGIYKTLKMKVLR